MVDVVRRDELPLLHIDNAPGASGFEEQVGLAAKERRDLNDIHHFRGRTHLTGLMNVGQDRIAALFEAA